MNLSQGTWIATCVALSLSACSSDKQQANETETSTETAQSGVKCEGINECKGHSECQSSDGKNACQGLNACKGMGWITVPSEQECVSRGGKLLGIQTMTDASAEHLSSVDGPGVVPDVLLSMDAQSNADSAMVMAADRMAPVRCEGINACKGQGQCASSDGKNGCKGMNECKGLGWISVPTEQDCTGQGGRVLS